MILSYGSSQNNGCLPVVIERKDHPISRSLIDPDALKVMYRLKNHGYRAYMVGGGVRDIYLGKSPKDFDLATDARPEEVRALFRNSRIIGRRFRLVQIYFSGGKIIEVSTFRRSVSQEEMEDVEKDDESAPLEHLPVPSENHYGNEEEDALRRDITINAIFYDIASFCVIDYVGGMKDLKDGVIRTVGDPHRSFAEDPVRMMRVLRHSARTGFRIEEETRAAIQLNEHLITQCSPARVREEFLRDLRGGWSCRCFQLMIETGLLLFLFPAYEPALTGPGGNAVANHLVSNLQGIDSFNNQGRQLPDDLLITAFIAPFVRHAAIMESAPVGRGRIGYVSDQVHEVIKPIVRGFGLSKGRAEGVCQSIFGMLMIEEAANSRGKIPRSLFTKKYFHDGYLLYRIECEGRGERVPQAIESTARHIFRMNDESRRNVPDNSGNGGAHDNGADRRPGAPRRRRRPHKVINDK